MDRRCLRYGTLAAALAAVLLTLPGMGCRSMLTTFAYLTRGTDVDPDFPGLKEKRVAVVCRPLVELQFANAGAARELAQQMGSLLQAQVPKIKVIDQQKVAKWLDEDSVDDYAQAGKALGADMVVVVDLTAFSTYEGQTLYRGKANVAVRVYDVKKDGQLVFEKTLPQVVYPPNSAIPASEKQEPQFRHEFVAVLADQIARHFYSHDPHADLTQDATAGLR